MRKRTALVVLSAPGGGKGELAKLLTKDGWTHFDMGPHLKDLSRHHRLLREAMERTTNGGFLVPDELMIPIMEDYFERDLPDRFVADGIPRSSRQAKIFYSALRRLGFRVYTAYFAIGSSFYDILRHRMLVRGRKHETSEVIDTRLAEFDKHNPGVLQFAKSWKHHTFREFDGGKEVTERHMAVRQLVDDLHPFINVDLSMTGIRLSDR